jgi:hypothetical protein
MSGDILHGDLGWVGAYPALRCAYEYAPIAAVRGRIEAMRCPTLFAYQEYGQGSDGAR